MRKEDVKTEEDVTRFLSDRTQFERDVLLATFRIPRGKVSTYKRVAGKIGRPRAYRAAGNALHRNPLAPIVPCHRVVRSDGRFGGPTNAAEARMKHLQEEGVRVEEGRVKLTEDILY